MDFQNLNDQVGLNMHRKDLQKIFLILDKQRTKRVRLEDLKGVASMIQTEEDREQEELAM